MSDISPEFCLHSCTILSALQFYSYHYDFIMIYYHYYFFTIIIIITTIIIIYYYHRHTIIIIIIVYCLYTFDTNKYLINNKH